MKHKTKTKDDNMNKLLALITLVLLLGLNACSGKSSTAPEIEDEVSSSSMISSSSSLDLKKVLSLSYNQGLKKSAIVCDQVTDGVDIDLGCFYKSGNYYFILNNNSGVELKDIVITTSNEAFEVAPKNIASLGAPDKSVVAQPILRVGVNHKTVLSSLAESSTLPYGKNETEITITGTVEGQPFEVKYKIGGFAYSLKAEVAVEDSLEFTDSVDKYKTSCAYVDTVPDEYVIRSASVNGTYKNELKTKEIDGVVKYCVPSVRIYGAPMYVNGELVNEYFAPLLPLSNWVSNNNDQSNVEFAAPVMDGYFTFGENKSGKFHYEFADTSVKYRKL